MGGEFENVQVAGTGDAATALTEIQSKLESDYSIDAVLALDKTNANTVGGGQPVLTGPGFVDKDNAATAKKLAEHGTR